MINKKILLNSLNDIKEFASATKSEKFSVSIVSQSDTYKIDAKSIIGIFSLELGKPLEIVIDSEECDDYLKKIAKFLL